MKNTIKLSLLLLITIFINLSAQSYYGIDTDTVKAQKFDMGKMWTFENFPFSLFESEYNFIPSAEWLEKMQKAALKFGGGCTASFISEDGLIMTNHHCIRNTLPKLNQDDEDILLNGFYAETPDMERAVPGLKVEQMLYYSDVTDEILKFMSSGNDDTEKIKLKNEKIEEIQKRYSEENMTDGV